MVKHVKKGEIAKKEYQEVEFFPFNNSAANSYILTANPFSYLQAWLDDQYESYDRKRKNAKRLEKAIYFCDLAESFNESAENSKLPVRSTLYYYSFLSLVKAYLMVNGYDLESKNQHHGLSMSSEWKKKIKIAGFGDSSSSITIFNEFSKLIGDDIKENSGYKITLDELLQEIPEVHEIGHALDLYKPQRKFLPVDISIMTNRGTYTKLFYEISYQTYQKELLPVNKLNKNHFKDKIYKRSNFDDDHPDRTYYRSCIKPSFTKESSKSWDKAYHKLTRELDSIGARVMLTKDGYRHYMNLRPGRLHRMTSIFALMFYLGSIARYRPSVYNDVIQGEYQPIINEVINTCPRQFYYLLVSRITNQVCAIPKAKI